VTPHQRLVEHLAAGALDGEDNSHSARCPACAALLSPSVHAADAGKVHLALLDAARRELARPLRRWWVAALALAAANGLLAAATVTALEPWNWTVSTSPHWLFICAALLLAALVTLGALLALAPARRWLLSALGLAALAPVAVLLAGDGRAANARFLDGTSCLLTVLVLSVLPLAGGALLLTRSAYSPRRALAVGLVSAGVGLLVLQFHCADGASPHLVVFHLLPWAALGGASILLRRLLPTSSYAP
jgi:Negative regulator of sigma F